MSEKKTGKLLIFSAPSGAGKTTLVRYLMKEIPNLEFSVSATSRKAREGEQNGSDYHFLVLDDFKRKIADNEFVEWEEVYEDHFYGTLLSEVERIRNSGNHVVFDVDVKGGLNIKKQFGDQALAVFVKPPSVEALKERLIGRNTETEETLKKRLDRAVFELGFEDKFDVTIVNDDLEKAKEESMRLVKNYIKSKD
ncbi:MAG: guanylate kinase [Bacteroidetes bacterium]|nr:MAG: guanylate kinase [Bacteroidota bacterium]